jgi:hypothetical protein
MDTIIERIVCSYPEALIRDTFDKLNLHCFNCVVGSEDTLRDVARLHDVDEEWLVEQLSEELEDHSPLDEPSYYG